ncbi:DUF6443 domain-containing protein [Chryseobacterium vrystaatense]|uniref:DUF6443 domain-containing protein n=1 Tax=Chryseobacterium vrystaatense TaxID=307480 RepID=UPI00068B6398|nr:DUF6443 domain-containing protein [Chryseobacterium vrystaatense]
MKKIVIPIYILFATETYFAQANQASNTENYIYTKTYLDDSSAPNPKITETVQYFDGLGRPKQIVNIKSSPLGRDLVNHTEYDNLGNQAKDYLPVPQATTNNGAIYTNPLANAGNIDVYTSEKIYSEKKFEKSPLSRISEQIQVGNTWETKPVKFEYGTNIDGEVRNYVATFNYSTFQSDISLSGSYGAKQLHKRVIIDEDNNKTIEFKNGLNQTLLIRKVISQTQNADTYYVYDDYNQLAYVIPPLAVSSPTIDTALKDHLFYQFNYDEAGRLVEKKSPGKDWEFIVYDKQDRVVAIQDGNLRTKGQWQYTKYDQFSRVIMTGICNAMGTTRQQEQIYANSKGMNSEERKDNMVINYSGMDVYYSVTNAYPQVDKVYNFLSVNYYDTYPNGSPSISGQILGQDILPYGTKNTKGFLLATYIKNTDANDFGWTRNYTYYDTLGRTVSKHSINYLGGYTKSENELSFAGVIKKLVTKHKRLVSDTERVITENFTYDTQDRLLTHTHKVNNNQEEVLAQNEYNELSQLKNKKVGGTIGNAIEIVDYKYNIRGWLTKINDPQNLNGKLFAYAIKYNNPENVNVSGKYNGGISEIDWKTSYNTNLRRYSYTYDGLDRLTNGVYKEVNVTVPSNDNYNEAITYDLNGNIKTLKRYIKPTVGITPELIDDLIYNYENNNLSNKINKITLPPGVANNQYGYNALENIFSYDTNGNMSSHLDRYQDVITYNHFNLPTYIHAASGHEVSRFTYRSDGLKVRMVEELPLFLKYKKITDYLDGFQYETVSDPFTPETLTLKFIPTSEGYYNFEKNKYIYNYTDHLGNIRVRYSRNSNGAVEFLGERNYYPLGLDHAYADSFIGDSNPSEILTSYNYAFNGKELTPLPGMYDFGGRFYNPTLGRFVSQDPMQVFDMWQSSYAYANNNPISYPDEYGMGIINVVESLVDRVSNFFVKLFSNDCGCGNNPESFGDAFRRPDFNFSLFRGSGHSSPVPPSANGNYIPNLNPVATNPVPVMMPNINMANMTQPNISGTPTPFVGNNVSYSPLPTNVQFNRDIDFNPSTTKIFNKALAEKTLYDLITTLQEHAELRVVVSGNTNFENITDKDPVVMDGKSGTISQLQLGRANAIKKLLIQKGIDPKRIIIKRGKNRGAISTTFELKEKR